jgi:hypothetical protein
MSEPPGILITIIILADAAAIGIATYVVIKQLSRTLP